MDSTGVKTLVLRFRDLVTDPGGTISLHREILAEHASVYWGWWNKSGERVPADVFQRVNSRVGGGLDVYLFDSGRMQVYRAGLRSIRTGHDGAPFATPDSDQTPAYYRDQKYMAWFEFMSIDEQPSPDPATILRTLVYERVDSFFDSGSSGYSPFYNKKIYSPEELRQQDRTIWFVRPATASDPSHEIRLLDTNQVAPYDFPVRAIESESRTLLWVSDLHLSKDHHRFPLASSTSAADLASALERDLNAMEVGPLAGMIVSGDLTWRGSAEEFEFARKFIRGVQSWSKLTDYQILICPGNHDVKFSPHPENLDEEVTKANEAARAEYAGLYEFLYNLPPNRFMSLGRRFLLAGAVPVEIVSINSSLLNQAEGAFQGHGFVGEEQLQEAARAMRWSDEKDGSPRAFRVVMLHHHIVPVTYREQPQHGRIYSVVLDAAAMTSWASRHDVDLILHGHMHQPAATRLDTPTTRTGRVDEWKRVTIVGMGSTGVAQADLGEIAQNTFGLMTFGPDEVRVAIHTIDPTRTRTRSEPAYVDLNVKYEWRK